ncbi:MAG: Spy/CpxP family protein refolding chaperone [Pyrinomonadaceae bacterium]
MTKKSLSMILSKCVMATTISCLCLLLIVSANPTRVDAQTSGSVTGAGSSSSSSGVASQPNAPQRPDHAHAHPPDLLLALNLSPEQHAQIRQIHDQSKLERRAAQQRLRQAQRALYEAVYADALNDAAVQERQRELAAAQAETTRMEVERELKVRRVLTPEQLGIFRSLRQRAREARRDAPPSQRRMENDNGDFRLHERFKNRRQDIRMRKGNDSPPVPVPREPPPATPPLN